MPLTELQAAIGRLLATNRTEDSYLAGGAAILVDPNTTRYSHDLDYFHDSEERVASAFAADLAVLHGAGFEVEIELSQPGYIRAIVRRDQAATKIEWARDSSWRFMPVIKSEHFGFQLHPVDLATNKVLALAGRDEPRDVLDTLHLDAAVLPLGGLVWAAVGKDPGFSPRSLLELLKRRGRLQAADLARLHLAVPVDPTTVKTSWIDALQRAEEFVGRRPPAEAGCLYYAPSQQRFVCPEINDADEIVPHFGRPGGVLPRSLDDRVE
jgi:hypothetical protein